MILQQWHMAHCTELVLLCCQDQWGCRVTHCTAQNPQMLCTVCSCRTGHPQLRGWANKTKIACFLIMQASAHAGNTLASQIRCTRPPLAALAASGQEEGLCSALPYMLVLPSVPSAGTLSVHSDRCDETRLLGWGLWSMACLSFSLQCCEEWDLFGTGAHPMQVLASGALAGVQAYGLMMES